MRAQFIDSMSSAHKPFALGGIGAQTTLDDVVRVAQGQVVALDPAGADRVKKLSPPPKQFQAEPWNDADAAAVEGKSLDAAQIRAIITAKLLVLINGRSGVRVQVCEYLTQLLNHNLVPAMRAADVDATVLRQLADACQGAGSTAIGGTTLAAGLEAAAVAAPGLSTVERAIMESGASASAGISAMTVQVCILRLKGQYGCDSRGNSL